MSSKFLTRLAATGISTTTFQHAQLAVHPNRSPTTSSTAENPPSKQNPTALPTCRLPNSSCKTTQDSLATATDPMRSSHLSSPSAESSDVDLQRSSQRSDQIPSTSDPTTIASSPATTTLDRCLEGADLLKPASGATHDAVHVRPQEASSQVSPERNDGTPFLSTENDLRNHPPGDPLKVNSDHNSPRLPVHDLCTLAGGTCIQDISLSRDLEYFNFTPGQADDACHGST